MRTINTLLVLSFEDRCSIQLS